MVEVPFPEAGMRPRRLVLDPEPDGVWTAYYPDRSGWVVFADELAALRHAVEHTMSVKFVAFGDGF